MLILAKEKVLSAYMTVATNGLMDKDFLIVKLQTLIMDGDLTIEEIQPILNVLEPPAESPIEQ